MSANAHPLRVLFYVQHLLGIGHLMRARRIALALQQDEFQVTLITGGLPVPGFENSGVEQIALPPIAIRNGDFGGLLDVDGNLVDASFKDYRRDLLLQIYDKLQPDIVMLEAFPFGRRQLRFELLPLIETVHRSQPRPLLVTSLRDIVQRRSKPGRDEQTAQLIKQYFDKVIVHGDPAFARLDESFPYAQEIADKIVYSGLVCEPTPKPDAQHFDVVVSAGGGAVGLQLVQASLHAAEQNPDIDSWCIVTGPHLPDDEFARIMDSAPASVTVERFRPDFTSLLAQAELSVSQAGYNTVADILQAGCRSLLVPYSAHGETEQANRAERLKDLGLAHVLSGSALSGDTLALAIRTALDRKPQSMAQAISIDGAKNTGRILLALVKESQ